MLLIDGDIGKNYGAHHNVNFGLLFRVICEPS